MSDHRQITHPQRIAIIGAGLGGLACARELAHAGHHVTVLEAAATVGGRARTRQIAGFQLNLGPHALYRDGVAARTLSAWGIALDGGVPTGNGGYLLSAGESPRTFPAGPLSLLTTSAFPLADKLRLARLMVAIPRMDASSLRSLSVDDWLATLPSVSPRVAGFIRAMVRLSTYVNAPGLMSAGVAVEQLQLALGQGVLYLHGGWQRLVDAVREQAEAAGATVLTSANVTGLQTEGGRLVGVWLGDGRSIAADAVVFALAPKRVARLLARFSDSPARARLQALTDVRASCLDIGLRGPLPRPTDVFALGLDEPSYLSVHSRYADLCPTGDALIHVAHYLAPGDDPAPVAKLELVLDRVQPGWRDQLATRRYLPRLTVCHAIPRADDGGQRVGWDLAAMDPALRGGYLVGDWVGATGMLVDAVFASALAVAQGIGRATQASALGADLGADFGSAA